MQCPTCEARTPWDGNPHRPFCSSTCRWVDLGIWLDERYRVAADDLDDDGEPPEDLHTSDVQAPPAARRRVP